jgi:hypothetical protein
MTEKYFKEQMKSGEFRRVYLEEKTRLDIEYRLEGHPKKDQKALLHYLDAPMKNNGP